jgi:DNA (cytosine-5)-methyltransferase 1
MITFVDLFCGGGFGARGAVQGGGVPLLGLDAWELATKTYKANFPDADVITKRIEEVNIPDLGKLYQPDVLLTSPECTSHSIARGAKPGLESSRETAIGILPWVEALSPRWLIVENVNRMKKWNRHDELVQTISGLGYKVSDLFLNSADFGSAQARKRMFLVCDKLQTSVNEEKLKQFGVQKRLTANDIVDWNYAYPSTPLYKAGRAKATLERAERAIAELGAGKPFIIVYYSSDYAGGWQSITAPLRTVTTWKGQMPHLRMLQPTELIKAMSSHQDHLLPFGNRRDKVKLCGNGVCSDVMTAIFRWIGAAQKQPSEKHLDHQLSASVPT